MVWPMLQHRNTMHRHYSRSQLVYTRGDGRGDDRPVYSLRETERTRDALVDDLAVVGESVTAAHPVDVDVDAAAGSTDARV